MNTTLVKKFITNDCYAGEDSGTDTSPYCFLRAPVILMTDMDAAFLLCSICETALLKMDEGSFQFISVC